jgi:Zn-dependent peptidase ImmA (M78 family)
MLDEASIKSITTEDIEIAAETLLEQYRITSKREEFPILVENIAEQFLGYSIDITDEGLFSNPKLLGGISFETDTIFVNASIEDHEGRYNFTIAHEIGHHVLHREIFCNGVNIEDKILCREVSSKPLVEQQADRFAAALLMPRKDMINATSGQQSKSIYEALKVARSVQRKLKIDNVSVSAIINRLKDLNLLHQTIPYQSGKNWRKERKKHSLMPMLRRLIQLKKKLSS